MAVEITSEGWLPDVVKLPQTGFYVGASNTPMPAVEHLYVLADGPHGDAIYRYQHPSPTASS